jgi:hypothetical protein
MSVCSFLDANMLVCFPSLLTKRVLCDLIHWLVASLSQALGWGLMLLRGSEGRELCPNLSRFTRPSHSSHGDTTRTLHAWWRTIIDLTFSPAQVVHVAKQAAQHGQFSSISLIVGQLLTPKSLNWQFCRVFRWFQGMRILNLLNWGHPGHLGQNKCIESGKSSQKCF